MKTDPKNTDYVLESGASRMCEPWTQAKIDAQQSEQQKQEEDRFEALERRQTELQKEMRVLDQLSLISALNAHRSRFEASNSGTALVEKVMNRKRKEPDAEVESIPHALEGDITKRLDDKEECVKRSGGGREKENKSQGTAKKQKKLADLCPLQPLVPYH